MFNLFGFGKKKNEQYNKEVNELKERFVSWIEEQEGEPIISDDIDNPDEINIDELTDEDMEEIQRNYEDRLREIDLEIQTQGINFNTYEEENLHDDLQILDYYIEYNAVDQAEYLLFNIRLKEDHEEEWTEMWKCVKLLRLKGFPRLMREDSNLLKIWDDVLIGLHDEDINFITVMANILNPVRIGLVYCYGVQSVAETPEKAKTMADIGYQALSQSLIGNFPQIEFRLLTRQEADWIDRQMREMKHLLMLRGIPHPIHSAGNATSLGIGGTESNPFSEEQNEQFLRGMTDTEFLLLLLTSPIGFGDLQRWLQITSEELSKYKSEMSGTRGISAGISIPVVFMGNLGAAFGKNFGESNTFGHAVGLSETDTFSVSQSSGLSENISVSHSEGISESVSFSEGMTHSQSFSESHGLSFSEGASWTEGFSRTDGTSFTESISESLGRSYTQSFADTVSSSHSFGINQSQSVGVNHSLTNTEGFSLTDTLSQSTSFGESFGNTTSFGASFGKSFGQSFSQGFAQSLSESFGQSQSQSQGFSFGTSESASFNQSQTHGSSFGTSFNQGYSSSESVSQSTSNSHVVGNSYTHSQSQSHGVSESHGMSESWGTNQSQSSNWSNSQSESYSQSQSTGGSMSESMSQSQSQSSSASQSISQSQSASQSSSQSYSSSASSSVSFGTSESHSQSATRSENYGASMGYDASKSSTFNYGISDIINFGGSRTTTGGFSVGVNSGVGISFSETNSASVNEGYSAGLSESHSVSVSESASQSLGFSQSISESTSISHSNSISHSSSWSTGESHSVSNSITQGGGISHGTSHSQGTSYTTGTSSSYGESSAHSVSENYGQTNTSGVSQSQGQTVSQGISHSESVSNSYGTGYSQGKTQSESFSNTIGQSITHGSSVTNSFSEGSSWSNSVSESISNAISHTKSISESLGKSISFGRSFSQSESFGTSESYSVGTSETITQGISHSRGESFGMTIGTSVGQSQGISQSIGQSVSQGKTVTQGTSSSVGQTIGNSTSVSASKGMSTSVSDSIGVSKGKSVSEGVSVGKSKGTSTSDSTALALSSGYNHTQSTGTSSSMALGPSISYTKSAQWYDENKANLVMVLEEQRNRLMTALRQGAFYVDVYILTPDEKSKKAAGVLATAAWYGDVFPSPVQVVSPDPMWAEHLMAHVSVFSACTMPEDATELMEGYKFSTVLLPEEMGAYCHPPRFEGGDMNTVYEAIPYFHLPGRMEGEAFMGWCVSSETGKPTEIEYRFSRRNMMHTLISGSSGSGKTTTSLRFISELINEMKFGATILDWKDDWRSLAYVVPEDKFKFYSLGTTPVNRLSFNPLAIPDMVDVDLWVDTVVESFVIGFGLGQRGYEICWRNLARLYSKHGAWKDTSRSKNLTLMDWYKEIEAEILDKGQKKQAGFGDVEAYNRVLSRMGYFANEDSRLYSMFGNPIDPVDIEELCVPGEIVVLEAQGMKGPQKSFLLGLIAAGVFQIARAKKIFVNQPHMIVFEEAHEVVKGTDTAGSNDASSGVVEESVYEVMWNEGRSAGLYLVAIAQMPTHLPTSVLANTRVYITHQLGNDEDVDFISRRMIRDPRLEHKDFPRFLERVPLGYSIIQTRNVRHHADAEPVLVKVEMIEAPRPTDDQIKLITLQRELLLKEKAREAEINVESDNKD